ncbi:MAG: hypothetical protein SRB1_01186 [Desulfobacteraceae bacterium Eth-SRB1]|nr:MAG: hypothetical protein SRB1_01186 [Desulfobacteraceae bacterium Eth-SRB1]
MNMNAGKHALRQTVLCVLVLLSVLAIPMNAAAFDDTLVLTQDFQEAIVKDAWHKGDLDYTQSLLDSALAKYPESAMLWDIQAGVELKRKNFEKAAEAGERALKISPIPSRHTNLGWIYQQNKQYTRAVMHYNPGSGLKLIN